MKSEVGSHICVEPLEIRKCESLSRKTLKNLLVVAFIWPFLEINKICQLPSNRYHKGKNPDQVTILALFLDHICMHLKSLRASEECGHGTGVSLHLEQAPASFQLEFHTYRSCGHVCFSCGWKILNRSKDLFWPFFYFFISLPSHSFYIQIADPFLLSFQFHSHQPPLSLWGLQLRSEDAAVDGGLWQQGLLWQFVTSL